MNHPAGFFLLLLILTQTSCALHSATESKSEPDTPTSGYVTVDKLPFREAWYGTYLNEEKIGYSHLKIEPSNQDFVISNDSLMKFTRMKKVEEVKMKERVVVRPDLTMVSFQSAVRKNGKDMMMTGRSDGKRFLVEATVDGEKLSREYPLPAKVYHSSAIGLMPALRGLKEGLTYTFEIFSEGKLEIEKIDQQIYSVKGPAGPNGAIWKVNTTVGPAVVNSWLNKKGVTVLERAKESSLIIVLEDESTAQKFLDQKSPGKDLVLDVSLIRISKPLPHPEKLKFLKARFQGIEQSLIPEDQRQKITTPPTNAPKDAFDVTVHVEDTSSSKASAQNSAAAVSDAYLASTMKIQSDHKEIVDQARKIVSPSDSQLEKVTKLTHWTAENIKSEIKESFTALSVLHSKEGECKSHAALYTALARSQHIPTRVVTGIVYSNQVGFLYHAWCESYINGWVAVDPTLNQIPADATHIKTAAGDAEEYASAVLQMVGKVKLEVLEYK
ncbi:MAG: transglutaminase-like domain-containing protein [Desulfomonilaceae bacterium]